MDPHPYADRPRLEYALAVSRGGYRPRRCGERDEECVALRVDLDAAVGCECLPEQPAVLRERLGVPVGPERVSSRVEPSMSVKRKVTVPVGNSGRIGLV